MVRRLLPPVVNVEPHETIFQYVAALRELASKSDFGYRADEVICDQLVGSLPEPRIRERLLLDSSLTLQSALTTATQMEVATAQTKAFCERCLVLISLTKTKRKYVRQRTFFTGRKLD